MFTATPGMFIADTQGLVLNVADFGFVPSASASQNDTAIAAALTAGGTSCIILIPAGNYVISKQISITSPNVVLISFGVYNTTIINTSSADPTYALSITGSHCLVSGITFQGRNSVSSTGGGINVAGVETRLHRWGFAQIV